MLMLDLCSGLKGASQAMLDRKWKVITVDINPDFSPDVTADIRDWQWEGAKPDLIWCSPPCTEFSREFMPWHKTNKTPDLTIYQACLRIIEHNKPRYWIIENVLGAVKYFGKPTVIYNPYYLWGFFSPLGNVKINIRHKSSYSSRCQSLRAKIPYSLSCAVALAIEQASTIFDLI